MDKNFTDKMISLFDQKKNKEIRNMFVSHFTDVLKVAYNHICKVVFFSNITGEDVPTSYCYEINGDFYVNLHFDLKDMKDFVPTVVHEIGHILNGDLLPAKKKEISDILKAEDVEAYFGHDMLNTILDHIINFDMIKDGFDRTNRVLLTSNTLQIPNESWEDLLRFLIKILKDGIAEQGGVHTEPIFTDIKIFNDGKKASVEESLLSAMGVGQYITFFPPQSKRGNSGEGEGQEGEGGEGGGEGEEGEGGEGDDVLSRSGDNIDIDTKKFQQHIDLVVGNDADKQVGKMIGNGSKLDIPKINSHLSLADIIESDVRSSIGDYRRTNDRHHLIVKNYIGSKGVAVNEINLVIDSSGSMFEPHKIRLLTDVINSLGKSFLFNLIQVDTQATDVQLGLNELPDNFGIIGGGGTNLSTVFPYISEELSQNPTICFTDGELYDEADKDFPIIWVVIGNYNGVSRYYPNDTVYFYKGGEFEK